ncbi:hypothetical protein [Acidithiobacillus sp.]
MDDLIDILATQAETIEPLPDMESTLRDGDDQPVKQTVLLARVMTFLRLTRFTNAGVVLSLWRVHTSANVKKSCGGT